MTADKFRQLALKIPGAIEAEHMGHPDFRLNGKIFATLGYPDETFGAVSLTPEQQKDLLRKEPTVFKPCNGKWGERGATNVHLRPAKVKTLRHALQLASENIPARKTKPAT